MKETDFHIWLKETLPQSKDLRVGLGDDAAIIRTSGDLAVAADLLVEGVHFDRDQASAEQIGAKAVNRNFSDMAAMGMAPAWLIVSAAVPKGIGDGFIKKLTLGMADAAKAFDASIVGGDTSRSLGGLMINVTVLGKAMGMDPITRGGAQPKDRILVTHDLGGSLLGKHLDFTPRVKEGMFLNQNYRVSAMIDISDGLGLDLSRILDASNKGARVEALRIPISQAAQEMSKTSGRTPLQHALSDGEDFELLFTLAPQHADRLIQDQNRFFEITDIGEILDQPDKRTVRMQNKSFPLKKEGYDHFV